MQQIAAETPTSTSPSNDPIDQTQRTSSSSFGGLVGEAQGSAQAARVSHPLDTAAEVCPKLFAVYW